MGTIFTAAWSAELPADMTPVGISRSVPRRRRGYRRVRALEPGDWFKSVQPLKYLERYNTEILSKLDPEVIAAALFSCGDKPVMLCFEAAADVHAGTKWCHRHIAAQWLEDTLGLLIEEVGFPDLDRFKFLRAMGIMPPSYRRHAK